MNPFSRNRYEYIPTHLYYLPSGLIEKLEDSKPSYVIGSRGSGKTTLLKALSWQERLENAGLNAELGGDAFRGRFVATYTKLPLVQVKAFREWLANSSDVIHSALFGYYFDLISAENLAHSLSQLISSLHFTVTPDDEHRAVTSFMEQNDFLLGVQSAKQPTSLVDCHTTIREARRKLERCAISDAAIGDLLQDITVPGAGEISKSLGACMAQALDDSSIGGTDGQWHFKCCFDEAECLDQRQLVVVNTVIRTSNWPVSYVISFVGQPSDLSLTTHESLTVQKADRSIISLDYLTRPEFEQLCDGVANVRIKSALSTINQDSLDTVKFRTSNVLGKLDLNEIVTELVKQSEGKISSQLHEEAQSFHSSPWLDDAETEFLPYVQAYLANRLQLEPPSNSWTKEKRSQASREFRKKFVASYLSICRELGVKSVRYAYANMVFGASDTCIRDYLSQMYQIYAGAKLTLPEFLTTKIPWNIQNEAIHKASDEKLQSIKTGDEVSNPERVRRITIALGELTGLLQRGDSRTNTHLASSERGLFHFGEPILDTGADEDIFKILKDASEAGFLRLKQDAKKIVGFKVHASMAPAFGFSYRGAYYQVRIQKTDIRSILDTADDNGLTAIARKIADRVSSTKDDPNQKTLFSIEDDEGDNYDDSF